MNHSSMNSRLSGLLSIHVAVLLFGVAGLFGKFLELSPVTIVTGRTLFASLALALTVFGLKLGFRIIHSKDQLSFILMGAILAVHWVTFFHAIQVSTVAIGLLTFASFPIFVTFLEPVFFGERLRRFDVFIAALVVAGLVLVIPDFDLSNNLTRGAMWGTLSGFTFALLAILNRKFVTHYPALKIALYQDFIACLFLLPFVAGDTLAITGPQWAQLFLLGVVFTALAHSLFISGMREVRAQLASVIACLEPVYGVALAVVLLEEVPPVRVMAGGALILGAIAYASVRPQHQNVVRSPDRQISARPENTGGSCKRRTNDRAT